MGILLKNGLVYDGTLNKPIKQDVYIEDDIIKGIGSNLEINDVKVIDCTNLIVAPGFIDAHSHNDFFLENDEAILPFLKQGITTQVVGNCGFSAFGINEESRYKDLVGGGLFKINEPTNFDNFSKNIENKLIPNIIPLVGHGTTRIAVSGYNSRKLNKDEIEQQKSLVEDAMKKGAFGGSLGLMYQPGMFAPKEELLEFAKIIKKYDGILTVHPRANSKIALGYSLLGKPHIEQALDEVIDIMIETGVRVEYSHLIFVGKASWKCVDSMLEKFKKAQDEGYQIAFDIYPFTYGASVITVVLPSWYLKLTEKQKKNKWNRFKLKLIINATKKLLGIDFSDMVVSYIGENYSSYEGKTVLQIAKEENIKPFDMYLKLVDSSCGTGRIMLGKYYNDDIIHKLMNHESSIYMTDAWYEFTGTQNGGTYQAFPYFLEKTKKNNIPLEQTINKMTGLTADRFKIEKRGYIKEGNYADITIFDYDKVKINEIIPNETPEGIRYVIVNGKITIENKDYTGVRSGILLKKN